MSNLHSNECLQAAIVELDKAGIPYEIEHRSKHILLRFSVDDQQAITTLGRSNRIGYKHIHNTRADIRKKIRDLTKTKVLQGEIMNTMTISESNLVNINGTPCMRDIDVATALGFTRADNIRNLIRANLEELKGYGEIEFSDRQTTQQGGRPSQAYMLNRDQAILISVLSRTPRAADVRRQVIQAFKAWTEHNTGTTQQIVASREPELITNEQAIQAITDAVAKRLSGGTAPAQGSTQKEDMRDTIRQLLDWQQKQFEQLHVSLKALPAPAQDGDGIDGVVTKRLDANARAIVSALTTQLQGAVSTIATSLQAIDQRVSQMEATVPVQMGATQQSPDEIILSADPAEVIEAVAPEMTSEKKMEWPKPEGYVDIADIYKMLGLRKKMPNKMSLSTSLRFSLERMAKKRRITPIRVQNAYGLTRNVYPKTLVEKWVNTEGQNVVARHLGKQAMKSFSQGARAN